MKIKHTFILTVSILISLSLGFFMNSVFAKPAPLNNRTHINMNQENENDMKLGAFSMSLNVKNLEKSRDFYENLGFKVFAGSMKQNYLIMKNENALIGLFQGMFEGNILTFNPGWDESANNIEEFDDVREIQKELKGKGIELASETDEKTSGPGNIMLKDPDGNVIYIDQHR